MIAVLTTKRLQPGKYLSARPSSCTGANANRCYKGHGIDFTDRTASQARDELLLLLLECRSDIRHFVGKVRGILYSKRVLIKP